MDRSAAAMGVHAWGGPTPDGSTASIPESPQLDRADNDQRALARLLVAIDDFRAQRGHVKPPVVCGDAGPADLRAFPHDAPGRALSAFVPTA